MRSQGLAAIAVGFALALLLPGAASGAAGDVFVADTDYGTGDGAVVKVSPGGGAPTVFGDDATLFSSPWGMVMDRDRTLLVADYNTDKILRVSRTGAVTEFFSDPGQGGLTDLAWGADGFLYVIDYITLNIIRIDPDTGAFTEVADNDGVPDWGSAYSIVVARDGTIYFTDGGDELFKFPPGGTVTKLYEGPLLTGADGLELSPDEKSLFVADEDLNKIVRIDRRTGAAADFATGFDAASSLTRRTNGGFLVGNVLDGSEGIDRVPRTGSPIATFSAGGLYDYPHDIVIEPPSCGGRQATVVGTSRRDVIRGSSFADVIATLGGNDVVRGLAGKDIICGGKGRDRLIGGKGRDKLRGGPGRDRLRQ